MGQSCSQHDNEVVLERENWIVTIERKDWTYPIPNSDCVYVFPENQKMRER